ncbi:Ig-like domain-containing protein [Microterricola gilva]|uniref:Ig-like domain-containing protein n=1 Tax=Microterricola gilva TaxID=393267 RepID=A0A4Q8AHM0_9MICO|nr:HtaA domain-containing protein [Microterricola gilva]RZU63897.1 Ig-like domain-containing protein [Microterricola gilva]
MKTLQQHRARPQRWIATLTIALLALGAPLATAAPAFASEAPPVVEPLEQPERTPVDEAAPADTAPADAADEPAADDAAGEPAAGAPEQATVAPAPEAAPPAAAPLVAGAAALAVTVDSASEEAGLSVRVVGTGFGATTGAYGALIEKGTEAAVGASGGYTAFGYWMTPGAIVDGAFDKSLVAATTALDRTKLYEVIVWQGHSAPNADTIYARADVAPTTEQWDALFPPAVAPTVSVSKTEGLNPAGETVTVTGTGFVPGDGTSGTRPPLAGKFGGSYVVFGRFADAWKPSETAPSTARVVADQKWAVPAADMATIGGANAGAIELKADGTFKATLTVTEEFAKNPGTGNYGIYTYSGSGAKAAQFETFTPITFAPKAVTPTVSVSKTEGLNPAGETVTVTGTGFVPGDGTSGTRPPLAGKFGGSYVVFGRFADAWKPSETAPSTARVVADQKWAVPAADMATIGGANAGAIELKADGTFKATLTVTEEFAKNPGTGNYGIYTYSGSGAKAAQFETFTPITFAPKAVTPTIAASVDSATAESGLTVRVVGSSFGTTTGAYAALIEKGTEANVDASGGYAAFGFWMTPGAIVGGAFDKTLVAPTTALDRTKQYEVIVWKGHTAPTADTIYARAAVTPTGGQWSALFPSTPGDVATTTTLSLDRTSVVAGSTVALTAAVTPATAQGSIVFAVNGAPAGSPVRLSGGAASAQAVLHTVGKAALTARFVPDAGFAASTSPASTVAVTSAVVPPVAPTVQGGSLSWGVGSVFRNYVTGPIAKGSISVSGGATSASGVFQFGQSGGSFNQASGTGTADYSGNVRFTGHGGILDLTFANPSLSVTGPSSASLSLSVNGGRVDFATVDLGAASRSTLNGATVFSGAPVTLTASGSSAFQGYYPAGQSLDPLTVTIGAAAAAPAGSTGTVSTASVRTAAASDIPATPPATTGITLAPAVLAGLQAGGQISFEVDGFEPNETGIRVVIYSTPTVLAQNLTADANGVVRWSGTLPATLTGQHTLTVQGSISKGVVLTIPERTVAGSCAVSGATLDWGFKTSFLAYISSGIASGGWELSGGTTEADGLFHWADGSGSIDAETGSGLVNYTGGIRFTGHDGALDTTIANPRIELVSATEGYLVLDVTGTTQQGEPIAAQAVRFGSLALGDGSLQVTADGITGTDIAAELTDAGAAAFGTYPAGDALDPVSFTLPTTDCAVVTEEAVAAETGAGDTEATATSADTAEQGVDWVVWILAAALAAAAAVIVVLLVKRRRAGAGASAE